ncbi:TRAP transporter small permease [Thermodesulfobacteriota bacterium]
MKLLVKLYDIGALISFSAMFFCVMVEVISRNIILIPTTWAEECSRFFCVWTVFLGSASAWYRGSHIVITGLVQRMPGTVQKALLLAVELICTGFLVAVWIGTAVIMKISYNTTTTAMEISISYFYLALFLGFLGMIVFQVRKLVYNFYKRQASKSDSL